MKFNQLLHIFTLLLLFPAMSANAQPGQDSKVYSSTNKKAIRLYEDGLASFEKRQLDKAIGSFNLAVREDSMFIEAYLMLAEAWNEKRDINKTLEAYNQSFRINPSYHPPSLLFAGVLEHSTGKYNEAIKHLELYLTIPSTSSDQRRKNLAESILVSARFAAEAVKNPVPFTPVNLGKNVNSADDEYFPAITADDQLLLFTRRIKDDRVGGLGYQEDFYTTSRGENGEWSPAKNMGGPINTPANEGAPTISADGQIIIFTACEIGPGTYGANRKGFGSCDLFYTKKEGTRWTAPINLGPAINSAAWETQPSFSADGRSLYFIRGAGRGSDKNGDIYVAYITDEGRWTVPAKLPDHINTPEDEQSVFIHPDGQTLYFSSKGHPGMGGFDIYSVKKDSSGKWGTVKNLGYPINTSDDENSLLVSADGTIGYFASDRPGGFGGLDLYSFELPVEHRAGKVAYLKGRIYDAETKKPLEARFELIDVETGNVIVQSYSNAISGEFLVVIPAGKEYALNASAAGYLFYSDNFNMGEGSEIKPFQKDVPLMPVKKGNTVVLRNVFFNTGSAELRDQSQAELNKLVKLLNDNPRIRIELGGHTDNVGDDNSNQVLSENRAKSVRAYLISKGIDEKRLTYRGYGETQPVATNDTPEGRQLNRRTEFRILED